MFEHALAEELCQLTQPYGGTGNGKMIPKSPLRSRSDDGAEYQPPEADDGRRSGLRPMLDKLDNVAAAAAQQAVRGIDIDSSQESDDAAMYGSRRASWCPRI